LTHAVERLSASARNHHEALERQRALGQARSESAIAWRRRSEKNVSGGRFDMIAPVEKSMSALSASIRLPYVLSHPGVVFKVIEELERRTFGETERHGRGWVRPLRRPWAVRLRTDSRPNRPHRAAARALTPSNV
jgi:hypothetical protein